jgi:hypothetical protein
MPLRLEALTFEFRTLPNARHSEFFSNSHEFKLQGSGTDFLKKQALMENIALF